MAVIGTFTKSSDGSSFVGMVACKRGDGPLPPIVTESGRQPDLVAWPPAER